MIDALLFELMSEILGVPTILLLLSLGVTVADFST